MTVSTMFLNNLSVVDHGYISQHGTIVGGSYNPSFLVSGEVTEDESVVIDFSTCKKSMKKIIDDDMYGFDHKTWIVEGLSDFEYIEVMSSTVREYSGKVYKFGEKELSEYMAMSQYKTLHRMDSIKVVTDSVVFVMPRDAIKWVENPTNLENIEDVVKARITELLETKLNELFEFNVSIETKMATTRHTWQSNVPVYSFRYTHGLKSSSSWGCQNIAHGHLSFVEFEMDDSYSNSGDFDAFVKGTFLDGLQSVIFICEENIKDIDDEKVQIEYTTARGTFAAQYSIADYEIVVLPTETTIEYLVDYMVDREGMREALEDFGVKRVMVSEGLSKGAVVEL